MPTAHCSPTILVPVVPPLIVFSGGAFGGRLAEADAAARLARDLRVPGEQILAETSPRTTREEAARISRRLQSRAIHRILLVTDSEHLARAAIRAFTVSLVHISTAIHNTRIARHDASP